MDAFLRKAGGQLLTHADQQRVLGLLADTRTALDEAEASKLNGVHLVRRARPGPQGGIYQVSGLGQLAASAQVGGGHCVRNTRAPPGAPGGWA
jgi:hypothetical protein